MMTKQWEPWFEIRRNGYGLTPTTWQGWCTTFAIIATLLASVQGVLYLVRDPPNVVLLILLVTGIELAVFIPFTYRHAKSPEEASEEKANSLAEKQEKVRRDIEEWKKSNRF